ATSEMEGQETFILLKFKNGELGMGIWPKNHKSSFIIPVLEPNCKWPMKSATLLECSSKNNQFEHFPIYSYEKRVIIEKRNSDGTTEIQELSADSESFNESRDDETRKTPSAPISIGNDSQKKSLKTMEEVIKIKGEEIQVLEDEVAASKANLLDNPVNLFN
ncbi:Uncharacterized protein APZ42_017124, partial [Daphnia magna]